MKSAKQRKRDERERMRARGFVQRTYWVRPAWIDKIVALIEKLS